MGTTTNAVLYFGFDFADAEEGEEAPFDIDTDSWEDIYVQKLGLKDDSQFFNGEGDYTHPEGSKEYKAAEKKWEKYHKERDRLVEALGVEIDMHCSCDFPIWYVCTKQFSACRGSPERINPADLQDPVKLNIEMLRSFCKIMGIKWKEPRWHLASYWG